MKLFIKYMVTMRCKSFVVSTLNKFGIQHISMDHGLIEVPDPLNEGQRQELKIILRNRGMELLNEKTSLLIENTIRAVIDLIRHFEIPKKDVAAIVAKQINWNPEELTNVFEEVKGISLEQYIHSYKIEFIKELLLYDKLTLNEMAGKLNYRNAAQLTYQFKKTTGLSPSYFKRVKQNRLIASRGQLLDIIPKSITH